MSPHELNSFLALLCMKVYLMHSTISTRPRPIDMLLCLPLPHPLACCCRTTPHHSTSSSRRVSVTVVKESSSRSMFSLVMICWTFSPLYPIVHSYLPFLSLSLSVCLHCALTSNPSPMFSFLYLPRSIPSPCITLNSFPQCFPYSFPASVASHYISFLSLSFIFLFFLSRSRNFIRYQVVYMSLSDGNRGAGIYCTENCILICL